MSDTESSDPTNSADSGNDAADFAAFQAWKADQERAAADRAATREPFDPAEHDAVRAALDLLGAFVGPHAIAPALIAARDIMSRREGTS